MPHARGYGRYGKPNYLQSQYIIKKFGGEARLAKLLGISRITMYRWQYARPYGTDGLVPQAMRPRIEAIARHEGVLLLPSDWEASRIRYDENPEVIAALMPNTKSLMELLE